MDSLVEEQVELVPDVAGEHAQRLVVVGGLEL